MGNFIVGGNRRTRRKPLTCRRSLSNIKSCIEYTLPYAEFEPTTLVVIDTDCTGSCKFNYHTFTTTTPAYYERTYTSLCNIDN